MRGGRAAAPGGRRTFTARLVLCRRFGGDPDNITVVGQSAGAHLSAMGVLHQALAKSHDEASRLARSSWSAAAAAQGQVDANDVASRVQSKVLSIDTGRAERELR